MLRSGHLGYAALSAVMCWVSGCGPDLGPCDLAAAQRVIYKRGSDGFGCKTEPMSCVPGACPCDVPANYTAPVTYYVPYVAGQALVQSSCGNGGVCHSQAASGALRNGAPAGLDFDLAMAVQASRVPRVAELRFPKGHATLLDRLEDSWALIDSGAMPPGEIGQAVQVQGAWYELSATNVDPNERFELTQTALPGIGTAEGKELVRNWLACGAPVVNGNVEVAQRGPDPIAPTWDAIHELVIADNCLACHTAPRSALGNGNLIMSDPCGAWKALFNHPPSPESMCAPVTAPAALVVPGQPENSLLMHKLDRSATDPMFPTNSSNPLDCGLPMPMFESQLGSSQREAIRMWIAMGANPPADCTP